MKKKSFRCVCFVFFIILFSSASFAQTDSGGSANGGADGQPTSQPSPLSFKRNNGNGTCGGEAQIRVAFGPLPSYMPDIEEIRYEGQRVEFVVNDVDSSQLDNKGYASYCIMSGNIPPAKKLAVKFRYIKSNQTFWLLEDDSLLN